MKQRLKKLIKLTIWASVVMYLINKFIESDALIRHLLKVSPNGFYHWKHGKIYYTKQGSGTPVLLVHELSPSSSQQEWTRVINELAKSHTVYAIDLLGCGRSEKPFITYTNYLLAELLCDFCREVIKEPATVIATGKSGAFAITAVKLDQNAFTTIILVNPESLKKQSVLPDARSKASKAILDCPLLGVSLYYLLMSRNQLEYEFSERNFYNPFHVTRNLINTYYEAAHTSRGNGRHLQASIIGNYVNFDIRHVLSTMDTPIHMIFGSEMENVDKIAASYKKIHNRVTCTQVEQTKMLPQLEAPQRFLSAISGI